MGQFLVSLGLTDSKVPGEALGVIGSPEESGQVPGLEFDRSVVLRVAPGAKNPPKTTVPISKLRDRR